MFIASLVFDLIRGMIYLHDSPIGFHGNLKLTNCLVDSRWVLKLTDFGHVFDAEWPDLIDIIYNNQVDEELCESLLYRAPELLRSTLGYEEFNSVNSLQKADTYSFAIILYKLLTQEESVFGFTTLRPSQTLIRLIEISQNDHLRPDLEKLSIEHQIDWLKNTLKDSWSEIPNHRPDFKVLFKTKHTVKATVFTFVLIM